MSRYVHVLVQKMAVNVDLGFILSLVDFFSLEKEDLQLEVGACLLIGVWILTIDHFSALYTVWTSKEWRGLCTEISQRNHCARSKCTFTFIPNHLFQLSRFCQLADDFNISRSFFDVLHLAPIKVNLANYTQILTSLPSLIPRLRWVSTSEVLARTSQMTRLQLVTDSCSYSYTPLEWSLLQFRKLKWSMSPVYGCDVATSPRVHEEGKGIKWCICGKSCAWNATPVSFICLVTSVCY